MENETFSHSERPMKWTPELIQILKKTTNPISRAVDFWLNNMLEGFVTKFAVDTLKAYNEVERIFLKGYDGRYLNSLNLWIKMLLCKKGVLKLEV